MKDIKELDDYAWSGHRVCWVGRRMSGRRGIVSPGGFIEEKEKLFGDTRDLCVGRRIRGGDRNWQGGLVQSLGGWSEILSLRGKVERVARDARILDRGDFVSEILAEAEERVKRFMPLRERNALGA